MSDIAGLKVLITAGPTYEPIDPVRFIGNRSSGKMGFAIAEELAEKGAKVYLVAGPVHLSISNPNIQRFDVQTAEEMYLKSVELFPQCRIAILAAAVSDFTPENVPSSKIKKTNKEQGLTLHLKKTKDILAALGQQKSDNQVLVGFSLETDHELENAQSKLKLKNLDFIVLNSLRDKGAGFGFDTNKISIINKNMEQTVFQLKEKTEVAKDIVDYLIQYKNVK